MSMTPDELEYAISRRLDGMLPLPEQDRLRRALASDASARAVEAKYVRLDQIVRSLAVGLRYDEEALARSVSSAIEQLHAEAERDVVGNEVGDEAREELARTVGEVVGDEAADGVAGKVGIKVGSGPGNTTGDQVRMKERSLAALLASLRAEQPDVDHEALTRRISDGIDAIERERQASEAGVGEYGSLDRLLKTSLPVPEMAAEPRREQAMLRISRWSRPLALAASLLIVGMLAVVLLRDDRAGPGGGTTIGQPGVSEVASREPRVMSDNPASPTDDGESRSNVAAGRAGGIRVAEFEVGRPNNKPPAQSASVDLTVGNGTTLPSMRLGDLLNDSWFRETEPRIEPTTPTRE